MVLTLLTKLPKKGIIAIMNEKNIVVNSFNEWDPLEEVIVGIVDNSHIPKFDIAIEATMPKKFHHFFKKNGGNPFNKEIILLAKKELENFCKILVSEKVIVRRPSPTAFDKPFSSPNWQSPSGLYAAMPRDILLVIGDKIIESPMAWRSRYFEINAYRPLLKKYFKEGANWIAAPKPELNDDLYEYKYDVKNNTYLVNENEPVFDAADFIRCGKDIFVQQSHVTNKFGIEWLRRTIGNQYNVHLLKFNDDSPMHIDATFMPIAPGKLLINPNRVKKIPKLFKDWDILLAPKPIIPESQLLYFTSKWISMNVFMLSPRKVTIEEEEIPLIEAFNNWGFEVITCPFRNFNSFGGSFHCATLDIRRKGKLESYF